MEPKFSESMEPLYKYIKENVEIGSEGSFASKGALKSGRGLDSDRHNNGNLDIVNQLVSVAELEGEGYLDVPITSKSVMKNQSPR